MNISTPENKGIISKNILSSNALHLVKSVVENQYYRVILEQNHNGKLTLKAILLSGDVESRFN